MSDSSHCMVLSNGKFSGTTRKQLGNAIEAFTNSDQKDTLVIHFHGGLVSRKDAEDMADRLTPIYREAGGYPFFVIWESQAWETIGNNWGEIMKENAVTSLAQRIVQFILGKLKKAPGEKGGTVELPTKSEVEDEINDRKKDGGEPFAASNPKTGQLDEELSPLEKDQFETLLKNDPDIATAAGELMRTGAPELTPELKSDLDKARTAVPGEKAFFSTTALVTAGVRILSRALQRFSARRDHGIYITVIEEVVRELKGDQIGTLLWKHMKKDTADSFGEPEEEFGGTALLKEIGRRWEAGHHPRIVLVGHSAGSIYICNLLEKAEAILPAEIKFEVVFLAPACTFKLLDETLENCGSRIASFRSYAMKDVVERKDAIFPPLYLFSLLYFVSGLLEDKVDEPLVGMQRFTEASLFDLSLEPQIERVQGRLAAFQTPWIWSDSSTGPGLTTLAQKHGDFDNEPETLKSVGHLISTKPR